MIINYFDFITLEKIISKQGSFAFNRTTNLQFRIMQSEIYGSLVTIQYHAECINPLYQNFTSNRIRVYYILLQTWPGHCLFSYSDHRKSLSPIYQLLHLITQTISLPKKTEQICHTWYPDTIWQQMGSKTLTTTTKLYVILLTESQQWFWTNHFNNKNEFWWLFSIEGGLKPFGTVHTVF